MLFSRKREVVGLSVDGIANFNSGSLFPHTLGCVHPNHHEYMLSIEQISQNGSCQEKRIRKINLLSLGDIKPKEGKQEQIPCLP